MDIIDIDISEWMVDNPGINPVCFFKKLNYYTINELKEVYKMLYFKSVRGRNANNFNWIWKKINEKTEINIEPRYQFVQDLENNNKVLKTENDLLRFQLNKLENKFRRKNKRTK